MYKKICRFCKNRNITVAELERILGFGRATIHKWKTVSPSVDNAKKVADYFGVTIDELLEEEQDAGP